MKAEHSSGLGHAEEFGSDRWVELSSPHISPLQEYNGFVGFGASSHIPLESLQDRLQETSFSTPPPLYLPQWPSQLTSPSQGPPPPPVPSVRPIAPATSISPVQPLKVQPLKVPLEKPTPVTAPSTAPSNARKTLTDSDRRRMCEYHEENPNVKQTEIGGTLRSRPSLPQIVFTNAILSYVWS